MYSGLDICILNDISNTGFETPEAAIDTTKDTFGQLYVCYCCRDMEKLVFRNWLLKKDNLK